MASIRVDRATFEKHSREGKIQLSAGYIQEVLEVGGYPGKEGVVQIMKGKVDHGTQGDHEFVYRVRINDGLHQYNVLMSSQSRDQIEEEKELLVEGTIISIKDLAVNNIENSKPSIVILSYQLLSANHRETLCDPASKSHGHSGRIEDHKGYRPTLVVVADWPEAQEFVAEAQENMAQPPAAKMAKVDDGQPQQRARAPPPPTNRRTASKGEPNVVPITAVTPYVANIRIHGVVSRKDPMRNIPAKNMKIFNFELTDSAGDTIRIACFNETAESMMEMIVENCGYYISGVTVKQANKQYNNTGHDYELTLRSDSKVEPSSTSTISVPKLHLKRVRLSEIASHCGNMIDVLAIVERMDENATEFVAKSGKDFVKRELELIDESGVQVRMTLWGDDAKNAIVDDYVTKVVAFKGVTPREFNGAYTLSTGGGTRIAVVPEVPGVPELYTWYETERPNVDIKQMSASGGGSANEAPRTIAGVTELQFGRDSDKGDYANLKAMITRINPANALYKGCSSDGCQKKVSEIDATEYRCEKCNKTSSTFKWLYMMQFELADETGQVYVTAFGDTAAKIVGRPANEVGDLKDTNPDEYQAVFDRIQFKQKLWRVRCKMETYNEETRQRLTVFSVDEVNYDKYIAHLEDLVKQLDELPTPSSNY